MRRLSNSFRDIPLRKVTQNIGIVVFRLWVLVVMTNQTFHILKPYVIQTSMHTYIHYIYIHIYIINIYIYTLYIYIYIYIYI